MKRLFFIIFVLLSFITQTIAEPGTHPVFSRLTYSDIFGLIGLMFGINILFTGFVSASKISSIYKMALLLILCFFLPLFFSFNIESTIIECLILLFLILLSVMLFQHFKDHLLDILFPVLIYTLLIASFLGFYDLAADPIGLPRLFPKRVDGEALSGFRNAGQAGAYFLVMLSILIPLRFSKLYRYLSRSNRIALSITFVLSLIFLFFTGKIAAYAGLLTGVVFYLLYKRNIKALIAVTVGIVLLALVWNNLETLMPQTFERVSYKFDARVVQNVNNESDNDFIQENFGAAFVAFEDRPFIGSGIGAFHGVYSTHEVHSTYLKMLGETGLIGTMGYILFMIFLLRLFKIGKYKKENPFSDYIMTMLPFLLGCLLSWSYTYHLRKREFWIMVSVLVIANYCAKNYNKWRFEELQKNTNQLLERD